MHRAEHLHSGSLNNVKALGARLHTVMADAATSPATAAMLKHVAPKVPATQIDLCRLVDLGTSATPPGSRSQPRLAVRGADRYQQITLGLDAQVLGLAATNVRMAIRSGRRPHVDQSRLLSSVPSAPCRSVSA